MEKENQKCLISFISLLAFETVYVLQIEKKRVLCNCSSSRCRCKNLIDFSFLFQEFYGTIAEIMLKTYFIGRKSVRVEFELTIFI